MRAPGTGPYELTSGAIAEGNRVAGLALPGEDGAAMRAELNRWFAFYSATSPIAVYMISSAFYAWVQLRRIRGAEAATRRIPTNRAQDQWDDAQEERVRKQKELLELAPADAVRELQGFAAGCRWLINRWQRLKGLIERNGTLSGRDRDEAIRLQGAVPAIDRLRESEAAFLTWACCLFAQSQPNQEEIAALVASCKTTLSLGGVEASKVSAPQSACRKWLLARIDQELARLRPREEQLWVEHEEPARTAEVEAALATVQGNLRTLARYERDQLASLKRNLTAVARECKRTRVAVPRGVPYETL